MKKSTVIRLLLASVAMMPSVALAQSQKVQRFEGELRVGFTGPLGGYHSANSLMGSTLGLEMRYNFEDSPWDCGLMVDISTARWEFEPQSDMAQVNRSPAVALTGDYNFRQGKKVNPFVGAGVGVAFCDVLDFEYCPSPGNSFYFAPRVGVELFHHLRLASQFNITQRGFHNVAVTLGLVIGGRPKK